MLQSGSRTILTTEVFDLWYQSLRDRLAARSIQARIDRVQDGNFGDPKPVGENVSEMRLDFGPGYRVYFTQRGMEVVILLAGGDQSSQSKDIAKAIELPRSLKE